MQRGLEVALVQPALVVVVEAVLDTFGYGPPEGHRRVEVIDVLAVVRVAKDSAVAEGAEEQQRKRRQELRYQ